MPISVLDLFRKVSLPCAGGVRCAARIPSKAAGVYAISLSPDPALNASLRDRAPVSVDLVRAWIDRVPTLTFNGAARPDPEQVAEFLGGFWLRDESIVYIGKASCLRKRLGQFFRHSLGDRKPHAGGHWLKTLSNLDDLHLYFCECASEDLAAAKEQEALKAFASQVLPTTLDTLFNPDMPIPFANREFPPGTRKQNRIRGDVLT